MLPLTRRPQITQLHWTVPGMIEFYSYKVSKICISKLVLFIHHLNPQTVNTVVRFPKTPISKTSGRR
jgi:hypothetical protein